MSQLNTSSAVAATEAIGRNKLNERKLQNEFVNARDNLSAGVEHLPHRARGISQPQVDAANGIFEQHDIESSLTSVEHGLFNAIVGRQAADVEARHAITIEQIRQPDAVAIHRVKSGIAVQIRRHPFGDDRRAVKREPAMKLGTLGPLHTMHLPKTAKILEVRGLHRMSIAGREDRQSSVGKPPDIMIERRHHLIALGDRQRTARTKIVLHVDNDERGVFLHRF